MFKLKQISHYNLYKITICEVGNKWFTLMTIKLIYEYNSLKKILNCKFKDGCLNPCTESQLKVKIG